MHNFDTRPFFDMPLEIPEETRKEVNAEFVKYLFVIPGKNGQRNCFCTACGERYSVGGLTRTQTPEERTLIYASHRTKHKCFKCGEICTVIERNRIKHLYKLDEEKAVIIFFAPSKNKVWYRCFFVSRCYGRENRREDLCDWHEVQRYELSPGIAKKYETFYNEWREVNIGEAFLWNHGYWCEKYSYGFISGDGKFPKDTFLKYNGMNEYGGERTYNFPTMKYLCWYAVHPQIEMLVKTGHSETVDEMLVKNTDSKSFLDWSKNTPWELHRLSKPVYKVWKNQCDGYVTILKAFHKLKYQNEKEMLLAKDLCMFCGYDLKEINSLIKSLHKYQKTFKDFRKYLSSQVKRINKRRKKYLTDKKEQYNQWVDYIRMASRMQMKNLSPFPSDLKSAHDGLVSFKNAQKVKEKMEYVRKQAPKTAEEILRRYPKTEQTLHRLKKYNFTDGKYSIIVPETVEEIIFDSMSLMLCTYRQDNSGSYRYFERINRRESYIFFVRKSDKPNEPWYQIEAEPSGTVRQKRTVGDEQYDRDMKDIIPFLLKWQNYLESVLDETDIKDGKRSDSSRLKQYDVLRKEGKKINYGVMAGKLLVDALEADLLKSKVG